MEQNGYSEVAFDRADPLSIFNYCRFLMGQSLHSLFGDEAVSRKRSGKGGLGQMVEELFFNYSLNSKRETDFKEASLELKCTPLLKKEGTESEYRIKERIVCTMIDYFELVDTSFEESHLVKKCSLMLLLFYLHVNGEPIYDYKFLFRVLWQLPEKDLILIKRDYETIAYKVRRGEAHLLSEGDTLYLGACRKGQKGDKPQPQPFSETRANKRAFSLKHAYMRYILEHVQNAEAGFFTNYTSPADAKFELVDAAQLEEAPFEKIIEDRFEPYIGKNYIEICSMLGIEPYQAKSKYADVCGLIASEGKSKRISCSDELVKSGIVMKTIRLKSTGMPKEAMSFKNIDYQEIMDNDEWPESEAYEIFTNRFLFVVFKPSGEKIKVHNNRTGADVEEEAYVLDSVFFWTMPQADLSVAEQYWENIRSNVLADRICLSSFWSISDHRIFHVRPKATKSSQKTANPNGGECDKYCYWLNSDYIKSIIDKHYAGYERQA